jgi:hypothetical protein
MAILWNDEAEDGVLAQTLVMLHPKLDPDGRNQFGSSEWEASPHQRLERLLREHSPPVLALARQRRRLPHHAGLLRNHNQKTQNLVAQNARCSIVLQPTFRLRGKTGLAAASRHHRRT